MQAELLLKLEEKVRHAVEVIRLLRAQVDALEDENTLLKADHEKWREDLATFIQRFDQSEIPNEVRLLTAPREVILQD